MSDRDRPTPYPWPDLLRQWSTLWLAPDAHEAEPRFPAAAHASGWLGTAGASEADIAAAERRLGVRLPPSYRQFLAASDGWSHVDDTEGPLLTAGRIGWLRDLEPDLVEIWSRGDDRSTVPDEEYFRYGEDQDCVLVRCEHFSTALLISDWGDSSLLMLNPAVVNGDGEWEAWSYASWYPGVYRYPGFWELMAERIASDYPDAEIVRR
ncbi:SMI1/KNR4 family protein [Kitasatospora sp. NPDC048365]|uniref:SMI1/KNR4 family protein n=1 Tax=Kitasatospora sp. NPDC048365 TaxID=3364050 RepID=UPI00371EFF8A